MTLWGCAKIRGQVRVRSHLSGVKYSFSVLEYGSTGQPSKQSEWRPNQLMIQRMVSALIVFFEIILLSLASSARAKRPALSLEQRLDRLVLDAYPSPTEPGAAVLVMVDGKPVLRKGYGMADVRRSNGLVLYFTLNQYTA